MEKETVIRPSLLAADFKNLGSAVEEMIRLGITHCHFDVMDGTFVEEISFGEPLFRSLKPYFSDIIFDVHLMTENPLKQAGLFLRDGAKELCFHYEAMTLGDIVKMRELRNDYPEARIGIAFSPETAVEELKSVLPLFDYVLVMSVVPGKGGQSYLPGSEEKIRSLASFRNEKRLPYRIGVDGGINKTTGLLSIQAGADFLVAGSYYFKATDKKEALSSLHGEVKA
mgnify:CR=1 FL=1